MATERAREARFERLARAHASEVGNYLRRRLYPLSPSDLDDLVEEVLLIVWRRLDAVPADAEAAWMIGVARNVLANARRRQNRRDALTVSMPPPAVAASAEDRVVADLAVAEALRALPEADREILLLHFWDGLDARQLAVALSVTTNAAAVRLSRAQARFRAQMSGGEP